MDNSRKIILSIGFIIILGLIANLAINNIAPTNFKLWVTSEDCDDLVKKMAKEQQMLASHYANINNSNQTLANFENAKDIFWDTQKMGNPEEKIEKVVDEFILNSGVTASGKTSARKNTNTSGKGYISYSYVLTLKGDMKSLIKFLMLIRESPVRFEWTALTLTPANYKKIDIFNLRGTLQVHVLNDENLIALVGEAK